MEARGGDGGSLDRRQDGDGRRDHAVPVEQRSSEQTDQQEQPSAAPHDGVLADRERRQREDAPLAIVVRARDERQVLDGDHDDERPEHQREQTQDVRLADPNVVRSLERIAEREEGIRPDIAVHHAERSDGKRRRPHPRDRSWGGRGASVEAPVR